MEHSNLPKNLNFVLIDDDAIQLFLIKKTLNDKFSHSGITSFTMPEAALEHFYRLNESDFENQIILLDLNMPAMTGWEVLDHLKQKYGNNLPSNARVYILSSSDLPEDIKKSAEYEMVAGFYSKPLDQFKINEIIESSLKLK